MLNNIKGSDLHNRLNCYNVVFRNTVELLSLQNPRVSLKLFSKYLN